MERENPVNQFLSTTSNLNIVINDLIYHDNHFFTIGLCFIGFV
jgi:hypothetical protein